MSGLLSALLLVALGGPCATHARAAARFVPHPDAPSKRVEYYVERPVGAGPWPTLVFLHGHQEGTRPGGKDFVDWGVLESYAKRGYLAVAPSQPGYGNSSGPADFCGAFTQRAVSAVIARLRADGDASRRGMVLEGISRGAVVAALIAARDPSIAGLVLISGVYDFPQFVERSRPGQASSAVVNALVAETGGGRAALRARSALFRAGHIKAAALILNGAQDASTDPSQAPRLAAEMVRHGGSARAIIYPDCGHHIPVEVRTRDVSAFLEGVSARTMKGAASSSSWSGRRRTSSTK